MADHPLVTDLKTPLQPQFLSPRQIADLTGLHVVVVRRAIDRGELRAHKLCSRLRIRREDFEAWVEQSRVTP